MAKKSTMNDLYINVALLFVWVPIYALFDKGDYAGLMANIVYLFGSSTGFYSLVIYLSPLVAATQLSGKIGKYIYWLPLIWNVYDYANNAEGYHAMWYFWVSLVISFYASLNIAKRGDM